MSVPVIIPFLETPGIALFFCAYLLSLITYLVSV